MATLHADFGRDLGEHFRVRLLEAGFVLPSNADAQRITGLYFSVMAQVIPAQPRFVHTSRELSCPREMADAFALVQRKMTNGEDLTPHLSRRFMKASHTDALLLDWDVHHFHVDTEKDDQGRIVGHDEILFARVTDTDIYLIGFGDHQDFQDLQLLEILHRNWPQTLLRYKTTGIYHAPTTQEHVEVGRAARATMPVRLTDGTEYFFGQFRLMNGASGQAALKTNAFHGHFGQLEARFRARIDELVAVTRRNGGVGFPDDVHLVLVLTDDDKAYVEERTTKTLIRVSMPWD